MSLMEQIPQPPDLEERPKGKSMTSWIIYILILAVVALCVQVIRGQEKYEDELRHQREQCQTQLSQKDERIRSLESEKQHLIDRLLNRYEPVLDRINVEGGATRLTIKNPE